jgi:hypothetical protein
MIAPLSRLRFRKKEKSYLFIANFPLFLFLSSFFAIQVTEFGRGSEIDSLISKVYLEGAFPALCSVFSFFFLIVAEQ